MNWIVSLETRDWIAIVGLLIGTISTSIAVANFLSNRRQQAIARQGPAPRIKATINKDRYDDGWRSVQLHIVPAEYEPNFRYQDWRIEHAQLMRPSDAVLARAENDDYASRVFCPDKPLRQLSGRAAGRPQRYALEFFLKFRREELGQKAQFKVTFGHANESERRTVRVWAVLPENAAPTVAEVPEFAGRT
jgi:hypothetical protein